VSHDITVIQPSFSVKSALQLRTPTRLCPPSNGFVTSNEIQEFHTVSFRSWDSHSGCWNGPGRSCA